MRKKAPFIRRTVCILLLLLFAIVGLFLFDSDLTVLFFQATGMVTGKANRWEEDENIVSLPEGLQIHSGISYDTEFPNSFLDIYYDESDQPCPVYLFIHGGGYAWGDKYEGDPLGDNPSSISQQTEKFHQIVRNGYAVVSINYALTPEYRYPVPLLQIDAAIRFLYEQADNLRLDMSRIVLAGGSAGGQLAGQYAAIVTDPLYAEEISLRPALKQDSLKGVVLLCALLEPQNFDKVNTLFFRFMFHALKNSYFLGGQDTLLQADVTMHLTNNYPPVYLTDGNHGTFDKQAEKFQKKLTQLGIENEYYTVPLSEMQLEHGYDADLSNPYAQESLKRELAFLRNILSAERGS